GLSGTDNCDDASITFMQDPLPNVTFGPNADDTIAVVITATDVNGTTATCEVILTIVDNELPVFVNCPDTIQVCNDVDVCGATVNWFDPIAVDNCDDTLAVVQTGGLPSGSVFPVGTTLVTYEATDDDGNATTCTFVVVVDDCQNPNAICADAQIYLDENGMATIDIAAIDGGSYDNCAIDTITASIPVFTCDDVGTTNVTMVVFDLSGNADSCVAEINVLDTLPPMFTCPADMTVTGCSGTIPDLVSGLTGTDNCGDDGIFFTQDPLPNVTFGPNANDTIEVIITATDVNGNTATCGVTLTIVDNEDPVFVNCPDTIAVNTDPGVCGALVNWFLPVAVDNCDDTMDVVQTLGPEPGSEFPVGVTQVAYTATDDDGNAVTCSFVVVVSDSEPPEAVCQDIFVYVDDNCEYTIGADEVDGGSTDNCSVDTLLISRDGGANFSDSVSFSIADLSDPFVPVILLVSDAAGNTAQCVATVTVIDAQDPMVICQEDITVNTEPGHCHGIIPNIIPPFDTTDNCAPVVNLDQYPEAGLLFGTAHGDSLEIFLIATDIDGNMDTCSLFVFLNDNEAPEWLNCPRPPVVQKAMPAACGAFVNFAPPIALDNCELDTIIQVDGSGLQSGDMFPVGITVLSWIAIDVAGNISDTCDLKVIVNDAQPPTIECPADVVAFNDPGECGAVIDDIAPVATDNCPDNLAIIFEVQDEFGNVVSCGVEDASGTLFPVGTNTVIYRAYDQPIVLISEVAQSGADMLEITNFGPSSVYLECLTIERLGAGAESAVIGDVTLAPGEVYVHAFANDIAVSAGAEYQISVEGTVHDVVATNGYAASTGWTGSLAGGDVWRQLICDHDTADDWLVVNACMGASIGVLNPGLPVFADNGTTTGLQSQLPNIVECSFNVTVNDIELPF
ncbi:MAG: HYR domain-containing protein, partial [Saprospiraceae bacterium]|nr:HYR domain-containing protein [Saprospiraceae bacterium]